MAALQPFSPHYGSGQTITTGAAASVAIEKHSLNICLTNTGSVTVYVRIGADTVVAATAADFPILAGSQAIVTKQDGGNLISTYSAAPGALHIMTGEGWK